MERIKVNVEGNEQVTSAEWEKGWQMAEDLFWAKQSEEVNIEDLTGKLYVPVARPSVVKTMDGMVEVDDTFVQFEETDVRDIMYEKSGEAPLSLSRARIIKSIETWFTNSTIKTLDLTEFTSLGIAQITEWAKYLPTLQEITLPKTLKQLGTSSWQSGLYWANNLKVVRFYTSFSTIYQAFNVNVEKIIVPSAEVYLMCNFSHYNGAGVPSQGGKASLYLLSDESTPLTSITIPSSITKINAYALHNLKTITALSYEGSVSEWLAIPKGASWHTNVPAAYIQCTDGKAGLDDTVETGNTYTE